MRTRILPVIVCVLLGLISYSQNHDADSLKSLLPNKMHDTTRTNLELMIGEACYFSHPDTAMKYWKLARARCEKALASSPAKELKYTYSRRLCGAINNIGYLMQQKGNFKEAKELFMACLQIQKESVNNDDEIAQLYANLGFLHQNFGQISEATEYYSSALKLREKTGNKKGTAYLLINLSGIYDGLNEHARSMQLSFRSLALLRQINDINGLATVLNNLGGIHYDARRIDSAMYYYDQSLPLRKQLGDKEGLATTLNNIGLIYKLKNDNDRAEKYFEESYKIRVEIGDKRGMSNSCVNLAGISLMKKNKSLALEYGLKSFALAKEAGSPSYAYAAASMLKDIYQEQHNYAEALKYFEFAVQMNDSISNIKSRKAALRTELKYEYEKQAAADSVAHAKESEVKSAELRRQRAELKAKKDQQYALFAGLALVMVFAGFMYNRFKVTKKQKSIIEDQKTEVEVQKNLVEEKQKEVLDSIHYARRIQLAQIPSEKRVASSLARLKK